MRDGRPSPSMTVLQWQNKAKTIFEGWRRHVSISPSVHWKKIGYQVMKGRWREVTENWMEYCFLFLFINGRREASTYAYHYFYSNFYVSLIKNGLKARYPSTRRRHACCPPAGTHRWAMSALVLFWCLETRGVATSKISPPYSMLQVKDEQCPSGCRHALPLHQRGFRIRRSLEIKIKTRGDH